MNKKLVYVDTDVSLGTPGAEIDDGAALIFLLRNPAIEMIGAGSVFGNVRVQDASLNLDRLLAWLDGGHIPHGLGAERPLLAEMKWFEDWQAKYGKTSGWHLRPATIFAANLILDTVHAHPEEVSLLTLGPMTNLALAIRLDPEIIHLTPRVIAMGGSFLSQNLSPEFNIRCDPEAAQIVLSAGWDVHILGLDVTRRVHFSRADFASLPDGNPAVELLRFQAPGWIDRMEEMGWDHDGCALHDAVAAAYLVDDTMFESVEACVEVEISDPRLRGVTRFSSVEKSRPIVKVITEVDAAKCRDLIWSQLQQ